MNPLWNQLAGQAGLEITQLQLAELVRYLDLLSAANERMNLTRIVDRASAELQHVADALTLLEYLPRGEIRIADIGSGGGVPAIPLAIVRSDARFTLIESTKKKAVFLRETAQKLELKNIQVLDERVEDVGQSNLREMVDAVTVRAVAEMGWLAEWGLPLLKRGGKLLAMKGPKAEEELGRTGRVISRLGGAMPGVKKIEIPELNGHVIVVIEKVRSTPKDYPRAATMAKGKMLQ
ncbi:MAG TPA: 16S rRNA (guanine(527)-N(7))-methyltransferase RsmG [Tepidisphaeraceae bacterium]|jgi:16S rRNA (guanine527-N7)-methyltransferase